MGIDLGETEVETRTMNRRATDKLFALLRTTHPEMARGIPAPTAPLVTTIEAIQRAIVAEFPTVTLLDLSSDRRADDIVLPRQIAMYLARKFTKNSLPGIGRKFGGRDHTTVLHAIRKIAALVETDSDLAEQIEKIKTSLGAS